jgi:hypothetical protein
MYQDITGNIGSPQNPNVSISSGFRTAVIHYVAVPLSESQTESLYSLGDNSYFSESAYTMSNPSSRYWGSNYDKLQEVKAKYDPDQIFWCHNCVNATFSYACLLKVGSLAVLIALLMA